ncbi:hypothetical protein P4O66_017700, partial [Electrophorus voltai]
MIDMIEKEDNVITEEEAAQYDRQIRLWGLEAQKRLRGSRVLLVGLRGLGAEVAKNLILAGVKGLTLLDHEQVTEESRRAQFLIPVDADGQNQAQASLERAQFLNPMVDVKADTDQVENKSDSFFLQFDAVCLTGCSRDVMVRVDQLCSSRNIKVFCGDIFGYHGYMFSDLGPEHHFVEEKVKIVKSSDETNDGPKVKKPKVDPNETTMVKKTASFCSLKEALEVDWTSEEAKASLKRTPPGYFLLHVLLRPPILLPYPTVLLKFRTDKGRDPHPGSYAEDSCLLLQIRDDLLEAVGRESGAAPGQLRQVLTSTVPAVDVAGAWATGANPVCMRCCLYSTCFSEMAPVCAVVGGVLGQEIV